MKNAEERKSEILDIAEQLFYSKGYENTSIAKILKNAGIARGTLYYYFDKKEDILDAVIEKRGEENFSKAKEIASDKCISPEKRLIMTLMAMSSNSKSEENLDEIHHPDNALLHQKINDYIVDNATGFLTEIVKDGIEKNIFNTKYPKQVVEMILIYVNQAFDHSKVRSQAKLMEKIEGFLYNINKLLGVEEGVLDFSEVMGGIDGI